MAQTVIELLAGRLTRVVVVTKQRGSALASAECPTYPYRSRPPVARSQRAGEIVSEALNNTSPRMLIVVCVSEGASALLVMPASRWPHCAR
jgi:glycerate-2-kinase